MYIEKNRPIDRFESWLTPGLFYFFLALLILLNLIVWFGGRSSTVSSNSSELISGLMEERNRLKNLIDADCSDPRLQSYGRGESGPLNSGSSGAVNGAVSPQPDLVDLLQSAAVVIVNEDSSGSGFFIDPTTVVTNRHVIEGVKGRHVLIANKAIGGFVKAEIVSVTRASDIGDADYALLHLDKSPPGIRTLSISKQPTPLQNVIAVGFPGSGIRSDQSQIPAPIYTSGVVSAVQPQKTGVSLIVHTADISPGSSGGALVDRCGAVVGVNTFVQSAESKAEGRRLYALSADSLSKFLGSSGQRFTRADDCQLGRVN